jgi:hypothetical protein
MKIIKCDACKRTPEEVITNPAEPIEGWYHIQRDAGQRPLRPKDYTYYTYPSWSKPNTNEAEDFDFCSMTCLLNYYLPDVGE